MPNNRPISDLSNNSNKIAEFGKTNYELVLNTKNGIGELAVQSIEDYEHFQVKVSLYTKLAEAVEDIVNGDDGADFSEFAVKLRGTVNGAL